MSSMQRTLLTLALALLASACGQNRPVHIGAVLPLSGNWAIYGQEIQTGIDLALEDVRATEFPYPLELTVLDSESRPERARELLEELFDADVVAAIGGVTSEEALAMVEVIDQYDRILISPSASNPELTGISTNFFRVFPSDFLDGTKMANFATQTLGLKTAVILGAESRFAKGILQVFKDGFERHGGEILEIIEYPPNTTDFSGLIDRVVTLRPDAVYLADFADAIISMVAQLRRENYEGKILTTHAFAAPEAIAKAGRNAEGVFLTHAAFEPEHAEGKAKEFVDIYKEKYGRTPGLFAAHGYDAMTVLAEGIKEGGRAPYELWKGLRGLENFMGVTGPIQFDEKGDVQKFPRVYFIKDGRPINYDEYIRNQRERLRKQLEELRRKRRELQTD